MSRAQCPMPMVYAAAAGAAAAYLIARKVRAAEEDAPFDGRLDAVSAVVRPNIRRLEPYRCARDDYESGVLLDANESCHGSVLARTGDALARAANALDLNRYPCPYQRPLKERVAAFRGVRAANVFVGVGSDEAIDLLFRVFCEPRRANVVVCPATYGMYKVCAAAQDVAVRTAPLVPGTFQLDVGAVEAAADRNTRLVFACSPGNPTSASLPIRDVLRLLDSPELARCIVVVDEAYVDFSETASAAPLVLEHPRLVVLHTLSKAFGLAGVRCGTAIGDETLVGYLNRIKAPYSINKLTASLAAQAFSPDALAALDATVAAVKDERRRLAAALAERPFVARVYPSDANFLLVKFKNEAQAKPLYTKMAESGVVVRYRGDQANLAGCLRMTVGTPADTKALLACLDATAADLGL